jgi:NAD(P)-dependent dehydrogenase (short-subunit alcohol dehydrogenase family)
VAQAIVSAGGEAFVQAMDLMDLGSLDRAVAAVLGRFGRVDVLVNNAVYQDRESNALLAELTPEALARTLHGNVVAPFHLVRALLPRMAAQGGGLVINVGSGAGRHDPPVPADQGAWGFAYGASKAALARLAGVIRVEHSHQGLRACTVNPGLVTTEAVTATLGDGGLLERRHGAMPPEAIARALLWLATHPDAAALLGQPGTLELQALVRERGL